MSILNTQVILTSYGNSGNCCNNGGSQLTNFKWYRSIPNIPTSNVLSQSQQVAVSTTVTLFSGSLNYTFFYFETDAPVTLLLNGTISQTINPNIVGTTSFPGIFMINSDIQSVTVQNASATTPANIFFAAAE